MVYSDLHLIPIFVLIWNHNVCFQLEVYTKNKNDYNVLGVIPSFWHSSQGDFSSSTLLIMEKWTRVLFGYFMILLLR